MQALVSVSGMDCLDSSLCERDLAWTGMMLASVSVSGMDWHDASFCERDLA